jgi:hypothetical protein
VNGLVLNLSGPAKPTAREAEQARTMIDDLTARLRELDEAIDHLRISRKTLLSLAGEPATEPAEPPPVLPGHPAYQQILTVFADAATVGAHDGVGVLLESYARGRGNGPLSRLSSRADAPLSPC